MKLFCSDLDNTLIFSYKHEIAREKVLVDIKDDKPISYMTLCTKHLLREIKDRILFVPITTRSLEQYKRIDLGIAGMPDYALAANGGILLKNNKLVKSWLDNTIEMISDSFIELDSAVSILMEDKEVYLQGSKVDDLFVFAKSISPQKSADALTERLNLDIVDVFIHHQKVYVFPRVLNKGTAVHRIKEYLKCDDIVSAGDSSFDIPMLSVSDTALIPEKLDKMLTNYCGKKVVLQGGIFSENVIKYVLEYIIE